MQTSLPKRLRSVIFFLIYRDAKSLTKHLLVTDLSKRYGNLKNGVNDIKKHRFMNTINLNNLLAKKISPPYRPNVKGEDDVSNFGMFEDSMKQTPEVAPEKDPFINGL